MIGLFQKYQRREPFLYILWEGVKMTFATIGCLVNSRVCKGERMQDSPNKQNGVGRTFLNMSLFFCSLVSRGRTWSFWPLPLTLRQWWNADKESWHKGWKGPSSKHGGSRSGCCWMSPFLGRSPGCTFPGSPTDGRGSPASSRQHCCYEGVRWETVNRVTREAIPA